MRSWLVVFGVLAGCGSDSGGEDGPTTDADADADTDADTDTDATGCYDVPITLVGGYGAASDPFRALAEDDVVNFTHGPQGGWHIETALQLDHVNNAVKVLPSVTVVSTGQQISGAQGEEDANLANVFVTMTGTCSGGYNGLRAYLDDVNPTPGILEVPSEICALEGEELQIDWTVTDLVDQRVGTTSVKVIAAMDPADLDPSGQHPNCTDY